MEAKALERTRAADRIFGLIFLLPFSGAVPVPALAVDVLALSGDPAMTMDEAFFGACTMLFSCKRCIVRLEEFVRSILRFRSADAVTMDKDFAPDVALALVSPGPDDDEGLTGFIVV